MSILDFIQAGEEEQEPISALGASMAPREGGFDSDSDFETEDAMAKVGVPPLAARKSEKKKESKNLKRTAKSNQGLDVRLRAYYNTENVRRAELRRRYEQRRDEALSKAESFSARDDIKKQFAQDVQNLNPLPPFLKWKEKSSDAQKIKQKFSSALAYTKEQEDELNRHLKNQERAEKERRRYARKVNRNMYAYIKQQGFDQDKEQWYSQEIRIKSIDIYNEIFRSIGNHKYKADTLRQEGSRAVQNYSNPFLTKLLEFVCMLYLGHPLYGDSGFFQEEYEKLRQDIKNYRGNGEIDAGFFEYIEQCINKKLFQDVNGPYRFRHDAGMWDEIAGYNRITDTFNFDGREYRVWHPLPSVARGSLLRGRNDRPLRSFITRNSLEQTENLDKYYFDVLIGDDMEGLNEWYKILTPYEMDKLKYVAQRTLPGYTVDVAEFKANTFYDQVGKEKRFRIRIVGETTQLAGEREQKRVLMRLKRDQEQYGDINKTRGELYADARRKEGDEGEEIDSEDDIDLVFYNPGRNKLDAKGEDPMETGPKVDLRTRVQIGMSMSKRRAPTTPGRVLDVNEDLASLIDMMIL